MKTAKSITRKLMFVLIVVGLMAGLISCAPAATPEPTKEVPQATAEETKPAETKPAETKGEVIVASYGGSFQEAQKEAFFTPFQTDSGVTVLDTTGSGFAKLKAMEEAGNVEWDVISADGSAFPQEQAAGLLEPLDYSVIDTTGLDESVVKEYGVGYIQFSFNLAWNKETYPEGKEPQSWADFFDTVKFPGRRGLPNHPIYVLEVALLADGVTPENLYPLDVDRAFAKLDSIKDSIVAIKNSTDLQTLVQQGELDMVVAANGRMTDAIKAGSPWGMTWNQAIVDTEWWVVAKNAPNKDNAMAFINFAIKPEQQAILAKAMPYGPTNTGTFALLDEELSKTLPSYPDNFAVTVQFDGSWWIENQETVQVRWDAWVLE